MNLKEKIINYFSKPVSGDILLITDKEEKPILAKIILDPTENNCSLDLAIKGLDTELESKEVYLYHCTMNDIRLFKNKSLEELATLIDTPPTYFPEVQFYMKNISFNESEIELYTLNHFAEYLSTLEDLNIRDKDRNERFIFDACIEDDTVFKMLKDSQKTKELCIGMMSHYPEIMKDIPERIKDFQFCYDFCCSPEIHNLKYIPKNLDKEQVCKLIDKNTDNISLEYMTKEVAIANLLKHIPQDYFKKYDFSDRYGKESCAYAKVTKGWDSSREEKKDAIKFFAENYFVTAWEFLDKHTKEEYYINKYVLSNPARQFSPNTLTPEEWHSIVEINTNMINHIPESVLAQKEFWHNYISFIDKPGGYLYNEENSGKEEQYFESEFFPKMPEELKRDKTILTDLYSRNLIMENTFKYYSTPECPVEKVELRRRGLSV